MFLDKLQIRKNKTKAPKELTELLIQYYNNPDLFEQKQKTDKNEDILEAINSRKEMLGMKGREEIQRREPILKRDEILQFLEGPTDAVQATTLSADNKEVGGINLNPTLLNMETTGRGLNLNIPDEVLNNLNPAQINGFTPIIFNITPIKDIPFFLGINK